MSRPSLHLDAGVGYNLALILLAPIRATMTSAEAMALIDLIKTTPTERLMEAMRDVERANALCVSSQLVTRFGNEPGMNEAQTLMSLAARYVDAREVMPPEFARYQPGWIERAVMAIPGGEKFNAIAEQLGDLYDKIVLKTQSEFTVDAPGSPLSGDQAPGYRSALTNALRANIRPEQ